MLLGDEKKSMAEGIDSLVDLIEAAAWATNGDIYRRIIVAINNCFHSHEAHLHIFNNSECRFVRYASYDGGTEIKSSPVLGIETGRVRTMLEMKEPLVMDRNNPNVQDELPDNYFDIYSLAVSVPLVSRESVIGMFTISYTRPVVLDDDMLRYLKSVGRMLGSVIDSMIRARRYVEASILDDRRRLSAEIHDNIAQSVSAVAMNAEAALIAYEEHDDDLLKEDLKRVADSGRKARKQLRVEMMSLRSEVNEPTDLIHAIQEMLDTFEAYWGIRTKLEVKFDPAEVDLHAETSLQLLRILNECLSNIMRHSRATEVTVSLWHSRQCVTMIVDDNGCGFDIDAVPEESMGIKIMKERAAAMAAQITIVSGEKGTTVCVDVARSPRSHV